MTDLEVGCIISGVGFIRISVHGRITHVVTCAGNLLEGAVEEASAKEAFDMFNTNVLGTCNVVRAAAPYLREGTKVAGQRAALATSKWAVSGLTEGLAEELRPFGVDVCCFEPGYTRTGFLASGSGNDVKNNNGGDHRVNTARRLSAYHGTGADAMRGALDAYNGKQPGDVGKSARVIVDVLTGAGVGRGKEVPVRLLLGADCLEAVRAKCEGTLRLVEEWETVTVSTMRDEDEDGDA
ncbi:hypothetical protein C8A05DRAFT_43649 [Staphylotrichum tortipilum]|uniref:Uncharacterized protein n=1 Tax=Staphylotrichum tortipilum TaxID=2831512 RepID=A0AAN6MLD9_9PEZI|nr:hypothetical protein C8A05DRAFT_43649 [Staphylotrichum longicolle]